MYYNRDDYLGALRRLTRQKDSSVYVKMLQRAQVFSSTIKANDMHEAEMNLEACNAFKEHQKAILKIMT